MAEINKMMGEIADKMGVEPLGVTSAEVQNAETDGSTLFFNPSFMSSIEAAAGEDGVRWVFAHELGHQVGGMHVCGHEGEFMADEFATRSLVQMGGSFDSIEQTLNFLHSMSPEENETHPAPRSRAAKAASVFQQERKSYLADEVEIGNEQKKANPNVKELSL
jgi:hypothetical protein